MVGWHHQLYGHEFEQALGVGDGQEFDEAPDVGDGQGSLMCCSPLGHKKFDTSWLLN